MPGALSPATRLLLAASRLGLAPGDPGAREALALAVAGLRLAPMAPAVKALWSVAEEVLGGRMPPAALSGAVRVAAAVGVAGERGGDGWGAGTAPGPGPAPRVTHAARSAAAIEER